MFVIRLKQKDRTRPIGKEPGKYCWNVILFLKNSDFIICPILRMQKDQRPHSVKAILSLSLHPTILLFSFTVQLISCIFYFLVSRLEIGATSVRAGTTGAKLERFEEP